MKSKNSIFDDVGGILPHGMTRQQMENTNDFIKQETVRDILSATGMTQAALADRFEIPLRTVEDWARGLRTPPAYVVSMMAELLGLEEK